MRDRCVRVLVVEDDELVRLFAAEALADEGFQVVEAATAEEALRVCADGAPEVLFTDIRLPGTLTGWDIAERCRRTHPRIAVIYATGFSGDAPRPVEGSVLLQKPYKAAQVANLIRDLTRPSRQQ